MDQISVLIESFLEFLKKLGVIFDFGKKKKHHKLQNSIKNRVSDWLVLADPNVEKYRELRNKINEKVTFKVFFHNFEPFLD